MLKLHEIHIYIDPELRRKFSKVECNNKGLLLNTNQIEKKEYEIIKNNKFIILKKRDKTLLSLPLNQKNFQFILNFLTKKINKKNLIFSHRNRVSFTSHFDKPLSAIEKKTKNHLLKINSSMTPKMSGELSYYFGLFKFETNNLYEFSSYLLTLPYFKKFESSFLFFHLKGQRVSHLSGVTWKKLSFFQKYNVLDFNHFYSTIKKSKIKAFRADAFCFLELPFNGSFLAKEVHFKKCKAILMISRNDFLQFNKEEIEYFEQTISFLAPFLESLIEIELTQQKNNILKNSFLKFPLPLQISSSESHHTFSNQEFVLSSRETTPHILEQKEINNEQNLNIYNSDHLQHSSFDLFHFQRIHLLGELLNTLRHELSNPLLGLDLASQLLNSMKFSDEDKELLRLIQKNIHRSQKIIENFASLYQPEQSCKKCELKKAIDEAIILSKSELQGVKVEINDFILSDNAMLEADPIILVQILFNLMVNAAQALDELSSPLILIQFHERETFYEIILQDNGPDIPQSLHQEIFQPFFTTKKQGTGLGLALSRNLALKIGGYLDYDSSDKILKGAKFNLKLPKLKT